MKIVILVREGVDVRASVEALVVTFQKASELHIKRINIILFERFGEFGREHLSIVVICIKKPVLRNVVLVSAAIDI